MLTLEEKRKVKDVISELNIDTRINFPYFLDCIDETNTKIKSLDSKLQMIINNQQIIDQKLNLILRNMK